MGTFMGFYHWGFVAYSPVVFLDDLTIAVYTLYTYSLFLNSDIAMMALQ